MEVERKNENSAEAISEPNGVSIEDDETAKIDIEGGNIPQFAGYDPIDRHKATTARWLAYLLIGMLGGSFVLHYVVTVLFAFFNQTAAMEVVERTFNGWLPVISGLAGAAVTYFFTRERNGKK